MSTLEERIEKLEREVEILGIREEVRRLLSRYAFAVDEKKPELLAALFARDATLQVPAWHIDARGLPAILEFYEAYWARFQNPRRYYANEEIRVSGSTAEAFTYWYVTQERDQQSILAWGTYEWEFRRDGESWRIWRGVIRILAMTTLDRGWAREPRVMSF
jgi:hypothetical protein